MYSISTAGYQSEDTGPFGLDHAIFRHGRFVDENDDLVRTDANLCEEIVVGLSGNIELIGVPTDDLENVFHEDLDNLSSLETVDGGCTPRVQPT